MVCLAPRAREDSVRPRRLAGVVMRPLNFTVRRAAVMPVSIAIVAVVLISVLIYDFLTFDRLVRFEYANHRDIWRQDGSPAGFFWRTQECTWTSGLATQRLAVVWLFRTPPWVAASTECRRWLRHVRIATAVWNLSVLVAFACFLLLLQWPHA